MITEKFNDLIGTHIFYDPTDIKIIGGIENEIKAIELIYDEETDSYNETDNVLILSTAELEKALKTDCYNGKNVKVVF